MSQPSYQLKTFEWADKPDTSDISYYLNSHHIDHHLLLLKKTNQHKYVPKTVKAVGSKGLQHLQNNYDEISLMVTYKNIDDDKKKAYSNYTASWIAPKSDVHSQQYFKYSAQKGIISIDQAHRGYYISDENGLRSLNPLFMNYEPLNGRFDCDNCYGFKSFEAFITLVNQYNNIIIPYCHNIRTDLVAQIKDTLYVTAILEAGKKSLEEGIEINIDNYIHYIHDTNIKIHNYSMNKSIICHNLYYPLNTDSIKYLIKLHNDSKTKLKPIGSCLSPNGLGTSTSR